MARISVLTAVTRPAFLDGLYASLVAQDVDWDWVVQVDGAALEWQPDPARHGYLRDPRVALEYNPKPLGSATTRNLALIRAVADRVLCVDDDDLLYPGALRVLDDALSRWPQCFGAWGRTDLLPTDVDDSAQPRVFKDWHRTGPLEVGTIGAYFETEQRFPVHVGAVLWRRGHLVAMGGYAALPRSIDTHPFLAAESLFPVCYVDAPVYRYRMHSDQMTATTSYRDARTTVWAHNFDRTRQLAALLRPRGSESTHASEHVDG